MSQPVLIDEPIPPAPKRRRRWLGCGLVILFVLTACSGFYGYLLYTGDRDLREAEAEADHLDPEGWRLDEIDAHRKVLPADENAAEVVMAIKSKLSAWPPLRKPPEEPAVSEPAKQAFVDEDLAELPPDVQLDAALLRDVMDGLRAAEPVMPLIQKLPTLRDGRFPLTWSQDIISTMINSQDARTVASLLRYRAILLAQEGKADDALQATRGVLVAARSVGDEPLLISQLIRIACTAIAVQTLERVLAQSEPSSEALKQMQELLEAEVVEPLLLYAVRGERAGLHQMMMQMKKGQVKASVATGGGGPDGALLDALGPFIARGSHGRMLRLLTEEVEIAKLPPEEQPGRQEAVERKIKEAKMNYDVLIALLMPAYMKVGEAWRRDQAYLRCAIVAVAAERYRHDHHAWPRTIDALATAYLKAVPTDPYDGQPLRYRLLPDGVVVYSVGPDKEDNGGARNRRNPLAKGTDYPFRLWNVDSRRKPPAEVLPDAIEMFDP